MKNIFSLVCIILGIIFFIAVICLVNKQIENKQIENNNLNKSLYSSFVISNISLNSSLTIFAKELIIKDSDLTLNTKDNSLNLNKINSITFIIENKSYTYKKEE